MKFEEVPPTLTVPLWPECERQLKIYLPSPAAGTSSGVPALVIFHAGGYRHLIEEGMGAWAAAHVMVGVEAEYGTQTTGVAYPQNFADGARAVRLVRARAAEWGVDPQRVVLLGCSAGGHLAALVASSHGHYIHPEDDLSAGTSARPDALVLCYPVISFVHDWMPGCMGGSAEHFFGRDQPGYEDRKEYSTEERVTGDLPPTFIWATRDDDAVPSRHSELFHAACTRARVSSVMIMYEHGPHCMGLALDREGDVSRWTEMLLTWLRGNGFSCS